MAGTSLGLSKVYWESQSDVPVTGLGFIRNFIGNFEYVLTIIRNKPLLALEAGCGTAIHSCILSYLGIRCIALDNSKRIIENAKQTVRRFRGKHIDFIVADIRRLPFRNKAISLCFSQGVLEHFSDKEIKSIIREQSRVSQRIIASIPSNNWVKVFESKTIKYPVLTRFLPPDRWAKIINKSFSRRQNQKKVQCRYGYIDLTRLKTSLVELRRYKQPFNILIAIG